MKLSPATREYVGRLLAGYDLLDEYHQSRVGDDAGGAAYRYLSFFIFANHLRDYLHEQDGIDRAALTEHVKTTVALARCDDLCTATKHSLITQRPARSDIGTTVPPGHHVVSVSVESGGGPTRITAAEYHFDLSDGTTVGAHQLARDVITAWVDYGLPITALWLEQRHFTPTENNPDRT